MQIKVFWYGKEYPEDWDFYAECAEGNNIDISIKNDSSYPKKAPNPKEMVLQGMAACTAVDIVSTLKKMRQPLTSLSVACEAQQTTNHPKIFKECQLIYRVGGKNLDIEKVIQSIFLSYTKYCGVHAIVEKSGCHIFPQVFINDNQVDLWDPNNSIQEKLKYWVQETGQTQTKGVALVVGTSKGIGKELVLKLAHEGYAVIPVGRTKTQFANKFIFDSLYLDITKPYTSNYIKELLAKNNIKLSLLVQNAGISSVINAEDDLNTLQLTMDELRYVYETNAFGLIESTNIFIPVLTNNATIILQSSTMGLKERDSFLNASYRMSKRTVIQYAKQAALQFASENKDISILSIHPGSVKTDLNPTGKITTQECVQHIVKILADNFKATLKKHNGAFWIYQPEKNIWEIKE